MDRLKRVVMQALASVGVEHDDLETFTDSVCAALVASFAGRDANHSALPSYCDTYAGTWEHVGNNGAHPHRIQEPNTEEGYP